jgi:spore coat polysaccharide biosynthesis protein SpsF (cytidylyltransferase family)
MDIGAIVVGRMDSRRLPGKVLADVAGAPLLAYVVSRVRLVRALAGRVVVATSDRPLDDPIAELCRAEGWPVFRGSAEDVAGRVLACATEHGWDWLARVNGDSPFTDPELLAEACEAAELGDLNLITNLQPRSFPYGVSVELIRTGFYRQAYARFRDAGDYEHVTRYLYAHLTYTRFVNIPHRGEDLSSFRLTIDTPDDLTTFRRFVGSLHRDWLDVTFADAVRLLQQPRRAA